MKNVTPQTFDLTKMLGHLRQSRYYAESLMKEKSVGYALKDRLKGVINRSSAAERDILDGLPIASRHLLETELLAIENTVQLEAIQNMLLDLPLELRDKVEAYAAELHHNYNQTEVA